MKEDYAAREAKTHTFTSMPVVYITVIPSAIRPMAVGDARDHALPPAVRTIYAATSTTTCRMKNGELAPA